MRPKTRKWLAIAGVLYACLMWFAYRWAVDQRVPEGNIFNRIEHEGIRRLAEERAAAQKQAQSQVPIPPTGEARLNAAGPAYVAARYDQSHVVFMVVDGTEARFSSSSVHFNGNPTRVSAPAKPTATLAGLQELYEPDSQALHFFPKVMQQTQPGDQWTLNLSPDATVPVVIDRPVIAPIGCSLAIGFLASVPADQQATFAASPQEYFAVRRVAVESADPPSTTHIGEIAGWKPSPGATKQIEQHLNERMKQEVGKIDARLVANAGTPGAAAGEFPVGGARPRLKEWLRADQGLTRGEGKLDYDLRAFRLTPDGAPRIFARARWTLGGVNAFLMTAWFKVETPKAEAAATDAQVALLSADASWSTVLRDGDATGTLGDRLDFETILNEFDADHDGWAELLVHSYDAHSFGDQPSDPHAFDPDSSQSPSTTITLYLYTDLGLVPMKTPLHHSSQSPESCVDP